MLSNKKPTPAMPERVILCGIFMCSRNWAHYCLDLRRFTQTTARLAKYASEIHPERGNSSLIYPGSSSLPGRFFLGLSEEVCPEALWPAESLSLKESKIYKLDIRHKLNVSIAIISYNTSETR